MNPDAPLPPLPIHLHPPTLTKRPSLDMQKEKEKESKDKERLFFDFKHAGNQTGSMYIPYFRCL